MEFSAYDFIYDGISSEEFCLKIINIGDSTGVQSLNGGSGIELVEDKVRRVPTPYLYGVEKAPVLTFSLTFGVLQREPLDATDRRAISNAFFGKQNYKWLDILQEDLMDVRFRCILSNPRNVFISGAQYAFTCDVICDAPWGWSYNETYSYSLDSGYSEIVFNNTSDDNGYYYPKLRIKPSNVSNDFSIKNVTDGGREFKFSDLHPNGIEEISVDNAKKIITSTNGTNRLINFNNMWLRFRQGENTLQISGFGNLEITCMFPRRVGG